MDIDANVIDASYFDADDGSITLVVTGGTPPYRFAWSSGDTSSTIVKGAGLYTVTVTDSVGLVATDTYTISQPLVWDVDKKPYDVGLLSDNISRDMYCRYLNAEGGFISGRTESLLRFGLRNGSEYDNTAYFSTFVSDKGDPILSATVYDSGGRPHEVMRIDGSEVIINGDLTVTGKTANIIVANITVQDHLITLNCDATSMGVLQDNGVVFGNGDNKRSILYDVPTDSLYLDTGLWLKAGMEMRLGPAWDTATTVLGPSSFECHNASDSSSIVLNTEGLTLTNCLLVDEIPAYAYHVNNSGLVYLSGNKSVNYASGAWNFNGEAIVAPQLTAGNTNVSTAGFACISATNGKDSSLTHSELKLASSAAVLNADGLTFASDTAAINFCGGKFRVTYDAEEEALAFQKLTPDGYVTKAFLD